MECWKPCRLKAKDIPCFSLVHILSQRALKLFRHDLPLVILCWWFLITLFSTVHPEMCLKRACSRIHPGSEFLPEDFWVLCFSWIAAVLLRNTHSFHCKFNGSVKSNKSLPKTFYIGHLGLSSSHFSYKRLQISKEYIHSSPLWGFATPQLNMWKKT